MTLTLLLQALLAPVMAIILAAFVRTWFPVILIVGFWAVNFWVKGTTIEAMDSIAMAFTVAAINCLLTDKVKALYRVPVSAVILMALSVWQVKNFASDISIAAWAIQFVFLAVALLLPEWKLVQAQSDRKLLNRFDVAALFWMIPVGSIAFSTPIAGSIVVGQMAGLVATMAFGSWFLVAFGKASVQQLTILSAVPALFAAQMAWHYVEIPWTSLSVALIGWLPLLWPGLKKQAWWLQAILVIVFFAALLAGQLYLEWPEESFGY
ncbi:MAG: hypothetical protein P8X74_13660 [Reinekea sp.]|jgi:hypothetical protein